MKHLDFNGIEESTGEFKRLGAGGYIVKILDAKDDTANDKLLIQYDIAEGEFANYWKETEERAGFWGGKTVCSYKPAALRFFKGFLTAVKESNPGWEWHDDERALIGKRCGFVLGEEEYQKADGSVGVRLNVVAKMSVDKIMSGNYKVPIRKRLTTATPTSYAPAFETVSDDVELPF